MDISNFTWPENVGHIALDDIAPHTPVSEAAYSACRYNRILLVVDLLEHYAKDPDFLTLRRGGRIAREHLTSICKWLLEHQDFLMREFAQPSAEDIAPSRFSARKLRFLNLKVKEYYERLLPQRAQTCLQHLFRHDYTYEKCHRIFFENYVELERLAYVGKKSVPDIKIFLNSVRAIALKVRQQSSEIFDYQSEVQQVHKTIALPQPHELAPEKLSAAKINELNIQIEQWFDLLPVRAQNALTYGVKYPTDYTHLYSAFLVYDHPHIRLRNIGKGTIADIEDFLMGIRTLAADLLPQPDQEFEERTGKEQVCKMFCISEKALMQYRNANAEETRFPVFRYLHELIWEKLDLDDDALLVIRNRLGWIRSSNELDELDPNLYKKINISNSKVFQLRDNIQKRIVRSIKALSRGNSVFSHIVRRYGIHEDQDIIVLSLDFCKTINQSENTDFSLRFFHTIFSAQYAQTHTPFGQWSIVSQCKYLIKDALLDVFDAEAFLQSTNTMAFARRDNHQLFHWPTYVSGFLKPEHTPEDVERVSKVARLLTETELASFMVFKNEQEATLLRTSHKKNWEYVFEALEAIGSPASATVIRETIVANYPKFNLSAGGVQKKMIEAKEHFISIGRSGLYGLTKWETERPNFRGGSIRDLIAEYLKNSGQPKHCREITDYVLPFRPGTSYQNIKTSLKVDKSGRFAELPDNFWTLGTALT